MSGVAYGDHGLIAPDAIPGADLQLDAVSTGAATIRSGADSMETVADDLPSKWQRLSGVYESPESDQVFALMDPVTDDVHTIGGVARRVASALDTYASTAAAPKRELDALRVEAEAFVARVRHGVPRFESAFTPKQPAPVSGSWNGYQAVEQEPESKTVPWYEDIATRAENDQLIRRVNEQVALLQAAQAECALAIKKASGASVKHAFQAPSRSDLDARGVDLPWSRVGTAEGKTWAEQFEEGFTDDLLKTLGGLLHLGGWDDSGEWSWGNAGSAWKSMGDGLVAFGMLVDPLAWLDAAADPEGQAGQTLGAVGDGVERWWEDAQEHPAVAAGAAASAVGTSFIGPEGWAGRAGRAEELASGLGKLGLRGMEADVRSWVKGGASQANIDALADLVDREYAKWSRTAGYSPASGVGDDSFASFFRDELNRFELEHPDYHRLNDADAIPHGVESSIFIERGGLQYAEDHGGHAIKWHVPPSVLNKEAFDDFVRSRFKGEKENSAYSLPVRKVDEMIASTLDANHEAIQEWIAAKRNGSIGKPTQEFEWPSDTVVGRYFDPDGVPPMRDASVVRVVLKFFPDGHPPYSIVTTYPREDLNG